MQQRLKKIIEKIYQQIKQLRIIPAGAEDPLPPIPEEIEVSETDLDAVSNAWDETMPDYKGILDAEVINRENA